MLLLAFILPDHITEIAWLLTLAVSEIPTLNKAVMAADVFLLFTASWPVVILSSRDWGWGSCKNESFLFISFSSSAHDLVLLMTGEGILLTVLIAKTQFNGPSRAGAVSRQLQSRHRFSICVCWLGLPNGFIPFLTILGGFDIAVLLLHNKPEMSVKLRGHLYAFPTAFPYFFLVSRSAFPVPEQWSSILDICARWFHEGIGREFQNFSVMHLNFYVFLFSSNKGGKV